MREWEHKLNNKLNILKKWTIPWYANMHMWFGPMVVIDGNYGYYGHDKVEDTCRTIQLKSWNN